MTALECFESFVFGRHPDDVVTCRIVRGVVEHLEDRLDKQEQEINELRRTVVALQHREPVRGRDS